MPYTKIQYFFWLFSGVEISLLKQCPGDYNRQAGIGFTIFMTCLFAALAGGFAAFRFSEGNWIATIVFGIVWGLLIFSIDRSMVVTLKKDPTIPNQKFWEPFLTRMILAGLLAFMISIPLEIEIFKGVIDIQLQDDVQNALSEFGSKVNKNTGIDGVNAEKLRQEALKKEAISNANAANNSIPGWRSLNEEALNFSRFETKANQNSAKARNDKDRAWNRTFVNVYDPETGTYFPKQRKWGIHWKTYLNKRSEEKKYLNEAKEWKTKKDSKNFEADKLVKKYRQDQQAIAEAAGNREKKVAARSDSLQNVIDSTNIKYAEKQNDLGFVRQYVAMENAAKKDEGVWFFLWMIRLLFFTIEILPTIVKLKTPIGDYDRRLFNHEKEFALQLENNLDILRQKEQIRRTTELSITSQLEQERSDQEVALNQRLLTDIADKQQDIAKRVLKEWHRQEKQKLIANHPKNAQSPVAPQNPVPITSQGTVPLPPQNSTPITQPPLNGASFPSTHGVQINTSVTVPPSPDSSRHTKLLDRLWEMQNSKQREYYVFQNDPIEGKIIQWKIDQLPTERGIWEFDPQDSSIIKISLNGKDEQFKIADLTDYRLNLVSTNGIKNLQLTVKA